MEYRPVINGNIMTLPKRVKKPTRKIEIGRSVNVEKNKTCLNGYVNSFLLVLRMVPIFQLKTI